jgi:DNA-binding SARP family transcriptional activator/tetratricopeptide (TPR) repeat protein
VDSLRVRLLGNLTVEGIEPASLGRRQARTLLKVLALHRGQPVSVDRLVDCLWPDKSPPRPADQISVHVSRLRAVLGSERILRRDSGYTLVVDWLDVDALSAYADEAQRRLDSGAVGAARAAASAGLALARGPLLADEADPRWAEADRARVARLLARLHHLAGSAALAAGDGGGAAKLAEGALAVDPFDEAALRLLMDGLFQEGRPASAMAAYSAFRRLLAEELGISPSPETEALHEAILLGQHRPPFQKGAPEEAVTDELPGRHEVLARLDSLLDRAVAGHGQVAIVDGEAGIGKSSVLGAFGRRAALRGVTVVTVRGDELGRTLPVQPLLDAIFELIRGPGGGVVEVLGPDVSVLGPLLGLQSQPFGAAELSALTAPGAGQAVLFGAVNSVLRRRAGRGPLAVVIDDLHLAGPATAAWLAQAARRLADCAVAIVGARREEEGEPLAGIEAIHLEPLDVAAAVRIVGTERGAELHARSGGHPLFLVELAAAPPDEELPASVRQAVEDRCARAGPAGATLRTAAVLGATVDLDLLAAVTETQPGELLDHLEEGVRRRLLVEESSFEFRHALVRQALAATVGATRSAFIHRQAGRALSRRPDPDPLMVAHHARLGGDGELASHMLTVAARRAVARFDQDVAAGLLDQAIELHDTVEARIERARVRSMLMRYPEAQADIAAAQANGAGPEALEVAAWAAHFQRRFPEALDLADRGARQAGDGELRASCLGLGGFVSLAAGDLAGARRRLVRAVEEQPGNLLAEAWMGWLCVNEGRPDEAVAHVHPEAGRGLAAYRFPNAYALMGATMALAMVGRPDEALTAVATLGEELTRMGAARWAPRPLNLRGWIVRNLGEGREADELNLAALEVAGRLDLAEPLANGFLDLAAGRLLAGDTDGAAARLEQAAPLSQVEHAFRWRHQLRFRLLRARLDLATGDAGAARAGAEALVADAVAVGAGRCEVQARLVAAVAAGTATAGEGARVAGGAGGAWGDGPAAPANLAEVHGLLERLGRVAGIESWWITADVARAFGIAAWADLARRRVAELLPRAGPYREALARAAERRGLG